MAPVDKLFRYVEAYEDLGPDFADLSEEQRRSISDFFHLLNTNPTDLKQRFVELWKQMPAIYQQFHKDLESRSLAYEGMLYRSVVENENIEFQFDEYVFIGFNLLQKVEQELFRRLKKVGKARFTGTLTSNICVGSMVMPQEWKAMPTAMPADISADILTSFLTNCRPTVCQTASITTRSIDRWHSLKTSPMPQQNGDSTGHLHRRVAPKWKRWPFSDFCQPLQRLPYAKRSLSGCPNSHRTGR